MNRFGLLTIALLGLVPMRLPAGAAPAQLQCVSTSRKIPGLTLKGWIPAQSMELDLKLADGVAVIELNEENGSRALVTERFRDRVFTLVVTRPHGAQLILYAIPSSMKIKRRPNSLHVTFAAVLQEAPKPQNPPPDGPGLALSDISMSCSYHWEI